MATKILINALDPEECRIAKIIDSKLEEYHFDSAARGSAMGNIYKGIVARVEPSLQAAFVDYGAERHGFLQRQEIHSDYYQDNQTGDKSLQNIVRRGQEMLVQVTKDPYMKKGAMLTTFISLPGRHLVLMPGSKTYGISRKIEEEDERIRIKDILSKLKIPEDFGIIVRTAGKSCTKTLLGKDLRYLLTLWRRIKEKGIEAKAPSLLYKEKSFVVRSIRDYLTPQVSEILIDDESVFQEVKEFINIISRKQTKIVKHYTGDKPIFTKHQLEDQISTIYDSRVSLKSGGSIVLEQTEALVSIDVNSGKATQKKSIEETAFRTNMEAAEEIARQLRLRDLGGLIVVDFIDMKDSKHKIQVERCLKTHAKKDKARTKIGRISKFGLLEMSRQRIRPALTAGSQEICDHCKGKGMVPSTESLGIAFLRKLHLETVKPGVCGVSARVPAKVAHYLCNKKRKEIHDLEVRKEIAITITGDPGFVPGEMGLNLVHKKDKDS
jgi:ribonuclease E